MSSSATLSLIDPCAAAATQFVTPLVSVDESNAGYCGNKAAQLGRLARLGYAVPLGVVVTTHSYELFLVRNGLDQIVAEFVVESQAAPASRLVAIATQLKEAFLAASMPEEIEIAINAWTEHSRAASFAVRSSASKEDSAEASFAGQYDSYLNVDASSIMHYVAGCFASLFNPRATLYRRRHGFTSPGMMAAIIQEMAASDYAGVVFTRAPRRRDQLLIECAPGLADGVVSGNVSPNRYFIDRQTLKVLEATEPHACDSAVIIPIAGRALAIEADFGGPLDIEFGVRAGDIHILQARPIPSAINNLS